MNAPLVNAVETGKNIKRLREEKGITVKELQKIFGFDTPQAIYRWQRGEILPCLDNLLVLAKILDVQVECKFRFIGSPIPLATDQCFRS